ncbi:hypothetical protein RB195_019972 [Necator americanus]|uniref:Uncharacterized protein n=1 Tax=Necator americanus TaxID=51031 RepID=A0ABR1CGL6_NECAM
MYPATSLLEPLEQTDWRPIGPTIRVLRYTVTAQLYSFQLQKLADAICLEHVKVCNVALFHDNALPHGGKLTRQKSASFSHFHHDIHGHLQTRPFVTAAKPSPHSLDACVLPGLGTLRGTLEGAGVKNMMI